MKPASTLYSFPYSLEKVQLFCEKHPRGCRNLRYMTERNHYQIVKIAVVYFQKDQLRWNRFKSLVKQLDDYDFLDFQGIPREAKRDYLRQHVMIATDTALDILHPDFT